MTNIIFQVSLTYSSVARSIIDIAVTWMHAMATNCTGYNVLTDREIYVHVYVP